MINNKLSFIALLLLADCFSCDDIFATLCNRILFKQPPNSDEFLYKEVINGIYIKTNKVVDNFPLFVNERGSISFQYSKIINAFLFNKWFLEEKYNLGLGAEADISKTNDPKSWLKIADQKNNVFGGVVTKWFQYRINKNVYLKENLTITCTNATDCLFRDLIFNYNNPNINNPLKDFFTPVENLFSYNRQVYKHSKFNASSWYLYYLDSYWYIGSNITSDLAYWAVFDHALKPEFITNTWKKYNGRSKKWEEEVGVTFQCRGSNKTCSDDRCTMNGVCSLNQLNKSTCTCFFSFTGDDCSKKSEVCKSDVEVANIEAGSLRAKFCLFTNKFYDDLCARTVSGGYTWTSRESCKVPTRIIKRTTRDTNAKVASNNGFFTRHLPGLFAAILSLIGPLIVCCILKCQHGMKIYSLWWYLSMVILLCFKSVYDVFSLRIYIPELFSTMDKIVAALVPTFYLFVLLEAQYCYENKYLDNTDDVDEIDRCLTLLYEKEPQVFISIQCYHLLSTGGSIPSYRKVTSYTESKKVNFKTWRDVSDWSQVPRTRTKVRRINLTKKLTFADDETKNNISNVKSNLLEANRRRDTNIESFHELKITGFKDCIIAVDGKRPFWMNKVCFQLANLLALSWPYRWLLRFYTETLERSICKEISVIESLPPSINLAGGVIDSNQSFQSEYIGLPPPLYCCTNSTFLSDSETIEPVLPPPYPHDEVR